MSKAVLQELVQLPLLILRQKFGALGHEIVDSSSKEKIEVHKGTIFEANVIGIDRSKTGKPGEKMLVLILIKY